MEKPPSNRQNEKLKKRITGKINISRKKKDIVGENQHGRQELEAHW